MRAFIFSVWAHVGETSDLTLAALKQLAAKQYTVAEQGGRYVVSASVQGKSFSYELPAGQTSADFSTCVWEAWRMLKIGGLDGQMTDAELEEYLTDAAGDVTDTIVASFTRTNYGC